MSNNVTPLVSICSITYNHKAYIRQCLDSLLSQKTDFTYEIIINDDCSTDGTTEIIKEYASKYPNLIHPIFHDENQYSKGVRGMFAKFCFPKARGKYIALCEGDDYWTDPLKLQKQVDFLEKNREYTMCFHRSTIVNETNGPVFLLCADIEDRDYSSNELFENWIVPTASMLFRRECLRFEIKNREYILNGDICLVLTCSHMGKVRGMSEIMSTYRISETGITYNKALQTKRAMMYPEHFLCIAKNFPLLDKKTIHIKLANSYWDRKNIRDDIKGKIHDGINAFRFTSWPQRFRYVKRLFKF